MRERSQKEDPEGGSQKEAEGSREEPEGGAREAHSSQRGARRRIQSFTKNKRSQKEAGGSREAHSSPGKPIMRGS
jgi:hypothetical protein